MKRDLNKLAETTYDLLIIGGGINGACAVWDAALRGLSVALIDKGDFGAATSANSLKIIHGGLRYLQHADFRRMRQSIRERRIFMRIAPHLVHPFPCLMPTYGHFMHGKELLSLALMINDLVGFDRNCLDDPQKHILRGRVVSKKECLRLIPGFDVRNLTGGAIWYDCQMYNSERLTLSFLLSADKAGASVANYVEVKGFFKNGNQVTGVRARDRLTEEELDLRARIVLNTTGPWINRILSLLDGRHKDKTPLSKAINLVTRPIVEEYAVGVPSKDSRLFFITPWGNHSLIGTSYLPYHGAPDDFKVTEEDILCFIDQINEAYPAAALKREDVSFFHGGLLPMAGDNSDTGDVALAKHYRIYDHKKGNGIDGLVSVMGVKYTESRHVARKAVDLIFKKLGKKLPMCITAVTPVHGGRIDRFEEFMREEIKSKPYGLTEEIMRHLVYSYGSEYHRVLKYVNENPDWGQTMPNSSEVLKAEVIHAIQEEMAQKLSDVIFRRTDLGSAGNPGEECLRYCAAIMATELGWDKARLQGEFKEVKTVFSPVID